jgi:hypothetical protein
MGGYLTSDRSYICTALSKMKTLLFSNLQNVMVTSISFQDAKAQLYLVYSVPFEGHLLLLRSS